MTAVCTVCGRQRNISVRQDPRGYVYPDCATRREMIKAKILKGEELMNKKEILAGLKDLVEDRESFVEPDEPDSIFVQDKAVLQAAIRAIRHYVPEKEVKP